jgi:Dyp-type peroxidase family
LIPVTADELLELDDIQGGIIPGFKKDYSLIIGLFIDDVPGCKAWLKVQASEVARSSDVLAFNRLYRAMRMRRGNEHGMPTIVWKSISFSVRGLQLLRPGDDIQGAFEDKFFAGMFNDTLQDPPGEQWKMGGSAETVPHILIVLAADRQSDLDAELSRLTKGIGESGGGGLPAVRLSGPAQAGATLPAPLTGHEHFGFKDGISQPAIRGLASKDPTDFFDARLLDPGDRNFNCFAEPGRPLVWPGQFLIGYKRQDPRDALAPRDPAPLKLSWQKNGSYLVYRRLQQLVHKFWEFCETNAKTLSASSGKPMSREFFASRLVGRWSSGAPVSRAPSANDDKLANDDMSNNNFRFSNPTPAVKLKDGTFAPQLPTALPDPNGRVCPFVGHVRKVNPRDDSTDTGGSNDTLRRLMLRRGIPYGPPKDRTRLFEDDGVDRGLLFMAYQGSITDQFEFVTQTWANKANAPHDSIPPTGHDPLIGQNAAGCFIRVPVDDVVANDHELPLPQDFWVIMTGGGYFFTPSISALASALCQVSAGLPGPQSGPAPPPQASPPPQAPQVLLAQPPVPEPPARPAPAQPRAPRRQTEPKGAKKSTTRKKGAKRAAPKRRRAKSGKTKK